MESAPTPEPVWELARDVRRLIGTPVDRQTMKLALLPPLCMLVLSACGPAPSEPGLANEQERQVTYEMFADCLRDHGANVGSPSVSPDGSVQLPPGDGPMSSLDELGSAADSCQPILSSRGLPPPGPIVLSEDQLEDLRRASVAFAGCLREEGIDWPDPEWEGGAIRNWDPDTLGVDITDAATRRSGETCATQTGFDPLLAHAVRDDQR